MQMQVILLQDVERLGEQFQTVTVKGGYGRNFLIPKKMAVVANKANTAIYAERLKQINAKENRLIQEIETLVERLKFAPIKVGAKVGTTDKIFGSVTNVQLADAIKRQTGIAIDRRKITIPDEVKTLGNYSAKVRFRDDLKYEIEFEVVAE